MDLKPLRRFDCYECEEDECDLPERLLPVCEQAIYCWKSTVRENNGIKRYARGCVTSSQQVRFMCNDKLRQVNNHYRIECCKSELCNNGLFPHLQPSDMSEFQQSVNMIKFVASVIVPLLVVILLVFSLITYYRRNRNLCSSMKNCFQLALEKSQEVEIESQPTEETTQSDSMNAASTCSYRSFKSITTSIDSNSEKDYYQPINLIDTDAGQTLMTQQTLSQQISLVDQLEKGSFNWHRELWHGIWQGEDVMVKIYSSHSEMQWARETEVYMKLIPTQHENVLGYLGSDMTTVPFYTQLWLVTHYHSNGSLRTYLTNKQLNHNELFKLCLSLTYGLVYIHTEIYGTKGKVSMAHRNITSENIYVKKDGTCAIGDFSYAVTELNSLNDISFLDYVDRRYMSPELLERKFDRCLDVYRRSDIYSFGLVFWEISRRCLSTNGIVLDYALPYSSWLGNDDEDITLSEMNKLVVSNQCRPEIPKHWLTDKILENMGALIEECWQDKPIARLSALRLKKTLLKLGSTHLNIDLND